jgi:CubicO group peptidase (beta-lactamase class C family)
MALQVTRLLPAFLLSLLALGGARTAAAKGPAEDAPYAKGEVGERIVRWVREAGGAGFSGAVLAARRGEVVAAVGVGSADLEGKTPVTPATLFEIASATKPFTAIAVLRLVERKKLTLDDSIATWLPGVGDECRAITVRHLLQHTSGIPGTNAEGSGTDLARVLPTFLAGGPRHPPGTHWEYWNQGYALASEVIARAAGAPYVAFCREAIFEPAKMKATGFTGDRAPKGATVAVGRSARGAPRSALEHPYGEYGFQYRGMGGIVTSVWDLWRWDRALASGKLLREASQVPLLEPGPGDYALGFFVRRERDRRVQSHSGGVRGFVCDVRRYPDEDGCLFVLSNRDDAPLHEVVLGVEQLLFGETPTVRLSHGLDEAVVAPLLGSYEDARGNRLEVVRAGAKLEARIAWTGGQESRMSIQRAEDGRLSAVQGSESYAFEVGEIRDGKAASLRLHEQTFTRRDGS